MKRGIRVCCRASLAAVLWVLLPALAHSQAWLPQEGMLEWSVVYNNSLNKKHYLPDGSEADVGQTHWQSTGFIASYAITDRLLVTGGIPYVRSRYAGDRPHPTGVDDGQYHETFTDLRLEVHYQAVEEPVALAPYLALVTPLTDYETLGHAAPGKGLNELWLGFFAGSSLYPWMPRAYVQFRYNYALVEKVADISHNRNNADLELGAFLTPKTSVRLLAAWQDTNGGIAVPVPPNHPLFRYHDQLAAESYFNLGGGIAWAGWDRVNLYGVYMQSVSGRNGHKLDHAIIVGIGYRVPAW